MLPVLWEPCGTGFASEEVALNKRLGSGAYCVTGWFWGAFFLDLFALGFTV
jgi:hypothetical protein